MGHTRPTWAWPIARIGGGKRPVQGRPGHHGRGRERDRARTFLTVAQKDDEAMAPAAVTKLGAKKSRPRGHERWRHRGRAVADQPEHWPRSAAPPGSPRLARCAPRRP